MLLQAGLSLDAVIGSAQTVGEQLLEVRRSFESMVDERPLVLVFDDAHWAEPALHDFIEQLGTRSEGRVLTLCLLRADDDAHADTIELGPLPDEQVAELADVLGANEEQRDLVTRSAGGNPLFAEQLIAYAGQGGRPESLPPSISMLIAARLDLLEPGERAVLQRAAVIGSSFSRAAVQDLAPPGESGSVAATLATLTEKHYLRRLRRQAGFRFHHVLVRDTAYASLPREERAALHERFADWLDERGEPDELVGYHLEQAAHQLSELKHDDRRARRLAADAGRRLGAAGIAAWKRGDAAATTALLRRATASLPDEDRRISLLCELGPALRARGELVHAQAVLEQALAGALGAGDRRLELRARLELEAVRLFNDPANASNGLLDTAEAAIPVFEALEDHRSLGRAWLAVAIVRGPIRNAYAACTVAANYALVHYERAGWPTATCLSVLSSALYNGPMPVEPAVDRAEQLIAHADLLGRAHVLARLGGLEAMRGGFAEARTMISWARETFEDLGQASVAQTECGAIDAHVELLAGDEAAAEEALRASCSAFERSGDSAYLATRAADLADLLERHGNVADAAHWCAVAETRGAQDDIPTQALCRATRARLLARAGRIPAAESCAREAVRLTASTDNLNQRARVLVSLADVLRKAGRPQNAAESLAAAVALYAEKGNLVAAEQARHRLGEVASK
jgi:tetratricopeptide (TPR) repeat protein